MTSEQEQGKEKRRFSQEQYDMLLRCSEKKDITEWNEWRMNNQREEILMQYANLYKACLKGANFEGAYLREVDLRYADLEGANVQGANLRGAHMDGVNLRGAHLRDARLERAFLQYAHLEEANFTDAHPKPTATDVRRLLSGCGHLENAFLADAHLENSKLCYAHLEHATLINAHLKGADLFGADLESTYLAGANLESVDLSLCDMKGADFVRAVVDGSTSLWKCKVDSHTDFRGVGLDSCRIDAGTKQLLKYNIRRMNWEKWYKEHWFWRWPFRLFWLFSDYGASGKRVVGVFFLLAFLFAGIYSNCAYWRPPGIVSNLEVQPETGEAAWHYFLRAPVRAVYFSIVTMTTLGFGDMYANKGSIAGHVILAVQVILGYVLLGALITRFAVLFTAGGPAGKFAGSRKGAS